MAKGLGARRRVMDWMLEARASQSFVFPSRRRDDAMDALGVSLATGDKVGSDWRWTQWCFFYFAGEGGEDSFSGRNMRLTDKALAAEEGGMRWDGHVAGLAICHFFSLSELTPPPVPRISLEGRQGGEPASLCGGEGVQLCPARPRFSPIFPFQLSHSASPSSHHSPSRAVSAVPLTEEFSVQILLRTSNPKKSPFFRSSSAMRTASTASGVMDGPKIAMLGSACPGGFKFIKLVTSGSGTDSEAEFVNSMWGGRRKGRENCETRPVQCGSCKTQCSRDAVYIFKKK